MPQAVPSSPSLAGKTAVQYVRMSTDYQEYSTENQKLTIAEFAQRQGITIIATYEDAGKSGVTLKGRPALRRLLHDVQAQPPSFDLVLVYDVSRWGRFQDADECAYYEYMCRQVGVQVIYCAEQFSWDGSAAATLMKTIKRTMAGEYSRELSKKVFEGQCRLAERGFWQGATPGYGLQRILVASDGTVKGPLRGGEHKSIQTDRVIVAPGDEREVALVQRIYDWYIGQDVGCRRIADRLNAFGICNGHGRPWNPQQITAILTGEKYAGTNIYARTSRKLNAALQRNPRDQWSCAPGVFQPVVDSATYVAAEKIRKSRTHNLSDSEMLKRLSEFVESAETVSSKAIDAANNMPAGRTYARRFGCVKNAYARVGYEPPWRGVDLERLRASWTALKGCVEKTTQSLITAGHRVELSMDRTTIRVDGELVIRFSVRLVEHYDRRGPRWRVRWPTYSSPDLFVVVRRDLAFETPLDLYVFPRGSLIPGYDFSLSLRKGSGAPFEMFRYPDEMILLELSARARVEAYDAGEPFSSNQRCSDKQYPGAQSSGA
ncbi:recombinase family protein [bacterium M00.F.Ca.ET.228.01.1.1]|nr:recombinase family protein [bacterium M00.F.Ca.ET.228.01.1.1]TGR96675.1 recombinase family protein [bacterium M00.F.Ca.ET.191.01.1.1]TGT97942.1 recombinase family protein [bacterium M00.F.Ca.ET.155.01.1.1]